MVGRFLAERYFVLFKAKPAAQYFYGNGFDEARFNTKVGKFKKLLGGFNKTIFN